MAIIWVSQHPQLRTGGFCWCKGLLPTCLCWWQPVHLDSEEDAGVLLNSVIYIVSVPYNKITQNTDRWDYQSSVYACVRFWHCHHYEPKQLDISAMTFMLTIVHVYILTYLLKANTMAHHEKWPITCWLSVLVLRVGTHNTTRQQPTLSFDAETWQRNEQERQSIYSLLHVYVPAFSASTLLVVKIECWSIGTVICRSEVQIVYI